MFQEKDGSCCWLDGKGVELVKRFKETKHTIKSWGVSLKLWYDQDRLKWSLSGSEEICVSSMVR